MRWGSCTTSENISRVKNPLSCPHVPGRRKIYSVWQSNLPGGRTSRTASPKTSPRIQTESRSRTTLFAMASSMFWSIHHGGCRSLRCEGDIVSDIILSADHHFSESLCFFVFNQQRPSDSKARGERAAPHPRVELPFFIWRRLPDDTGFFSISRQSNPARVL